MFDFFLEQSSESLEALEQALAEGNEAWRSAAHRFKGFAANLGATHLTEVCRIAEEKHQLVTDEKIKMLGQIKYELQSVQNFITSRGVTVRSSYKLTIGLSTLIFRLLGYFSNPAYTLGTALFSAELTKM